jgi:hypothetical protein
MLSVCTRSVAQQGVFYQPNPHAYWYFLSPTGFGPPPNSTIYQDGLVAIWQYQRTTANGNTLGIGLIPTLLLGEEYMPMWVSAHRRVPLGGRAGHPAAVANVGGFFLNLPKGGAAGDVQDFSLFYANCTFGSREKNFALGAAIAPTGFGQNIRPQAITLHGLARLGRRSCLLTENYLIHDRGVWIPCSMAGWRSWRRQMAFDVALFVARVPAGSSVSARRFWLPIPWLAVHRMLR